jgi:hypothetical protein
MLTIFIWLGSKLFSYIDVYSPNEKVEAVTFSNSEEYIDKIVKI